MTILQHVRLRLVVVLAVVMTGLARPLELESGMEQPRVERQGVDRSKRAYDGLVEDDPTDVDAVCSHWLDDTDMDIARATWFQSTAGRQLDEWINEQGYENWVRNLDQSIFDISASTWDCATLGGTCGPVNDCASTYGNASAAPAYWIFFAVSKANDVFTKLQEDLQNNIIQNSLDVGKIVADFGDAPATNNPFAMVSGAFGVATAATGLFLPLSIAMGVLSGSFGAAAQFYRPDDIRTTLSQQVLDFFVKTQDAIQDTVNNAFGEGIQENLPAQTETDVYTSPVARFFADGKFLIESVEGSYKAELDEGTKRLKQGLITRVLKDQQTTVFIDLAITSEDDCIKPSALWLDSSACWRMVSRPITTFSGFGNYYSYLPEFSDDMMQKMTHYEFNLEEMYRNAYECMTQFPDGTGEVTSSVVAYEGALPECFFNLNVTKGTFEESFEVVPL